MRILRSETNTVLPIPGPVPPAPLPALVARLGYCGLAPLHAPLLAIARDPHHDVLWLQPQLAYGAVILGFVGALHWGFAMALPGLGASAVTRCFLWSVMPARIRYQTGQEARGIAVSMSPPPRFGQSIN